MMTRSFVERPVRQKGYSLIELMISIALASFITLVTATVYISAKGSFNYENATSRLQENARYAMDNMARNIRMAGMTSCFENGGKFADTISGGATSWWLNMQVPVMGYEGSVSTFPSQFTNRVTTADAITLLGSDSNSEMTITVPPGHNPSAATIPTTQHSIQPGAVLVISDCKQTSVFMVSGPTNNNNNATQVNHNTGNIQGTSGQNCSKFLGSNGALANCTNNQFVSYTFREDAVFFQLNANGYYIAPSAQANNGNSLWVCSLAGQTTGTTGCSELVNGVEDMQIMYGIDTDADKSANYYARASGVSDWNTVVSVRVNLLLATSPLEGMLSSKPQTYTFNGTSRTATDRRVYHVYSSTVNLRNRTK